MKWKINIEKVVAYQTENGVIFKEESEAIEAQKEINFKKDIANFSKLHTGPYEYNEVVYDTIVDNADKLYKILKERFEKEITE